MAQFREVLLALNRLKTEGVVRDYAIGGAVAAGLWDEPVATQDLDVVVLTRPGAHELDPPRSLTEWFARHGQSFTGEHLVIAGVPVQFLGAWSPLVEDAVTTAAETPYDPSDPDSPTIRVIRPTDLVAMWQAEPSADTAKRRERAARLREAGLVDDALLAALLSTPQP